MPTTTAFDDCPTPHGSVLARLNSLETLHHAAEEAFERIEAQDVPDDVFDLHYNARADAWDDWVEAVEVEGLTYTRFDPRGPRTPRD
jgi:hypothetical protein